VVRAVLDTNVLLSALIRPCGPPGRILDRLTDGAFELVLSPRLVDELRRASRYRHVRKYVRLSDQELEVRLAQIETVADPVEGTRTVRRAVRDPHDLMFLAAAVEGRADYIVTGDEDLLALDEHEDIAIVTPRAFLDVLEASQTPG
jgi:hypothetical protein